MVYHTYYQNYKSDQYLDRNRIWKEESLYPENGILLPEEEVQKPKYLFDFSSIYAQNPDRESADGFVYQVRFKYVSKYFLLGSEPKKEYRQMNSLPLITNGNYVCVEADRGLDIGVVIAKAPLDRSRVHFGEYKHILRVATQQELNAYSQKLQDEENATKV